MVRNTGSSRCVVLSVTVFVASLQLTSCVAASQAATDVKAARDSLVATVENSAAQLDVAGWSQSHAPEVGDCGSTGGERANYSFTYGAPAPSSDRAADARKVADYWRSLGMQVRLVESPDFVVYGSGGPSRDSLSLPARATTSSPESRFASRATPPSCARRTTADVLSHASIRVTWQRNRE